MRVLLDTNVLIAAVVAQHGDHGRSLVVLERVQNEKDEGFIAAHSLAEMYAVLTKMPPPFRHTPAQALASIEENFLKYFKITSLTGGDYAALIREAALTGIQGGTIYDAVLLQSAIKSGVDRVYTSNLRHFQNIAPPEMASRIFAP